MRELLFRLLKKQDDGSYEVVGFEKHVGGRMYRTMSLTAGGKLVSGTAWCYLYAPGTDMVSDYFYKDYDRKDQYTGIDIDRDAKLFKGDEVELTFNEEYSNNQICMEEGGIFTGAVRFMDGCFEILDKDNAGFSFPELINNIDADIKIIGIQGVTND